MVSTTALARRFGLLAGAGAGLYIATNPLFVELTHDGLPATLFYPTFPRDLIFFLVGAPVLLPMGLWLATAGLGIWTQRRQAWLWAATGVVAAVVLVFWLVLRPAFFYPRFFIFLIPAVAFLMAAAIPRGGGAGPGGALGGAGPGLGASPGSTHG